MLRHVSGGEDILRPKLLEGLYSRVSIGAPKGRNLVIGLSSHHTVGSISIVSHLHGTTIPRSTSLIHLHLGKDINIGNRIELIGLVV